MSEPQKTVIEQQGPDGFGFCVRFDYTDTWCDVKAWEIIGEDLSSRAPLYNRKGFTSSPDPVRNPDEAEEYLTGFVKWDGCSEFDFGRQHWCGPPCYRKHFALLEHIYKRAQQLMPSGNDHPWDVDGRILRFKAPGPWVTRELRECVQASDYDALAAQLETMRASCAQAARDAVQFQDERNALSAQCQEVRTQRDKAQASLAELQWMMDGLRK